jgi:hypothetical protein
MLRTQAYMKEKKCGFVGMFSDYMLPRTVWTTAKTFAKGKRMDFYRKFIKVYSARKYMKLLTKSARNRMLRLLAELFCINKYAFYTAIGIVYKNR